MVFPAFTPRLPGGLQQTLNQATTIGTPTVEPFAYNTAPQPQWFTDQSQIMQAAGGSVFGNAATAAPATPEQVNAGILGVVQAANDVYSSALREAGRSVFGGVPQMPIQPLTETQAWFNEPEQVQTRATWQDMAQSPTLSGMGTRLGIPAETTDYSAATPGSLRDRLEQQRQGRSQYGAITDAIRERPLEIAGLLAAGAAAPYVVAAGGGVPLLGGGLKLLGGMLAGQLGSAGVQAIPGIEKLPDPIERGAVLAPYFAAGPGSALFKAGGVATSVLGGEAAQELGASRGAGEFVGGFAGAVPSALARGGLGAIRNQIVSRKAGGILDDLAAATDEADLIARLKRIDPMDLLEVNEAVMRQNPELAKELGRTIARATAGDQQAAQALKGALYSEATSLSKRVAQMTGEAPQSVRQRATRAVSEKLGRAAKPQIMGAVDESNKMTDEAVSAIRRRRKGGTEIPVSQDPMGAGAKQAAPSAGTPASPPRTFPGVVQEPLGSILSRSKELSAKQLREIAADRGIEVPPGRDKASVLEAMREVAETRTYGSAAKNAPPKPPKNPALTPKQQADIDHWTSMTQGVIENESTMQKVYEAARPVTTAISGDVRNSKIAELIAREAELHSALARSGVADDVAKETARNWRNAQLNRYFQGDELTAAKEEFSNFARNVSFNTPVDAIAETWKATTLNADFSVLGQQVEASAHRGIIPIVTGSVNAIANKLGVPGAANVYLRNDIDRVWQAMADGLQPFGGKAADINARQSMFGKIPGVGRKIEGALDKLADFQYGTIMGSVRLRAYEGLLLQNKIIHGISFGKLGGDITDPLVRRHIAEFANTIGSTARGASGGLRQASERRLLLSPRMTRSQVNEVLTPLFTLRSQEDAINTANLLGSYVLTMGAGKALHDLIGAPGAEFSYNPLDYGFGKVTTAFEDAQGRKRVIDFMPQDALSTAIFRSIAALKEDDTRALQESWQKFGLGRLNFIPGSGLAITGGVGYGKDGKFYAAFNEDGINGSAITMPLEERLQKLNPVPLTFRNIGADPARLAGAEGRSDFTPVGVAAGVAGQGMYPESTWGAQDRTANEKWSRTYEEAGILGQAAINKDLAEQGIKIESYIRTKPYEDGAPLEAYKGMATQNPALEQFGSMTELRESVIAEKVAAGKTKNQAESETEKYINGLRFKAPNGTVMTWTELQRFVRMEIVRQDPDLVDDLSDVPGWLEEFLENEGLR